MAASNFVSKPLSQNKAGRTKRPLKLNHANFGCINPPCFSNTLTPTVEEWEYICNPEPELSYLKDQIRKKGFINEEI
jgi:hypothetical protein